MAAQWQRVSAIEIIKRNQKPVVALRTTTATTLENMVIHNVCVHNADVCMCYSINIVTYNR